MALDNAANCMCLENILCLVADQHACTHRRENDGMYFQLNLNRVENIIHSRILKKFSSLSIIELYPLFFLPCLSYYNYQNLCSNLSQLYSNHHYC